MRSCDTLLEKGPVGSLCQNTWHSPTQVGVSMLSTRGALLVKIAFRFTPTKQVVSTTELLRTTNVN